MNKPVPYEEQVKESHRRQASSDALHIINSAGSQHTMDEYEKLADRIFKWLQGTAE